MCKVILTDAQRFCNIDFKCCPYSKERIIRDRQEYTKRTGKPSFYYHCCKCKRSKRLANLEPIDGTYLNLWCENCLKDKSDDEYIVVKGDDNIIESTSSELSFSDNNLKSFGLDEESIRKFCLDYFSINNSHQIKDLREQLINNKQEFDKNIKERDSKLQEYEDEIESLKFENEDLKKRQEDAYRYYKKENTFYWKRIQKLQLQLDSCKCGEKRKSELEDNQQRKRRNSII